MRRPHGYLGCVDAELRILGQVFPVTLDLYGGALSGLAGDEAHTVIDSVMIEKNDITVELPSEAIEVLTTHVNSLPVKA